MSDDEEQYEVEIISKARCVKPTNSSKRLEFYTKWKGYPEDDCSWEPLESFKGGAEHFVDDFWEHTNHGGRKDYRRIKNFKVEEFFERVGQPQKGRRKNGPRGISQSTTETSQNCRLVLSNVSPVMRPLGKNGSKRKAVTTTVERHTSDSQGKENVMSLRPLHVTNKRSKSRSSQNKLAEHTTEDINKPGSKNDSSVEDNTIKSPDSGYRRNKAIADFLDRVWGPREHEENCDAYSLFRRPSQGSESLMAGSIDSVFVQDRKSSVSGRTLSGISSEILVIIFTFVLLERPNVFRASYPQHFHTYLPALSFSQTCRHWRNVLQSTPNLWCEIRLDIGMSRYPNPFIPEEQAIHSIMLQCLQMSKQNPVNITIGMDREIITNSERTMLALLVAHCNRWSRVAIDIPVLPHLPPRLGDLTQLTWLKFTINERRRNDYSDSVSRETFLKHQSAFSSGNLQYLGLANGRFMNEAIFSHSLTNVAFNECNLHAIIKLHGCTPNIKYLAIEQLYTDMIGPRIQGSLQFNHLEYLRVATQTTGRDNSIDENRAAETFLSHIEVPALIELEIIGPFEEKRAEWISSMLTNSGSALKKLSVKGGFRTQSLQCCLKAMDSLEELHLATSHSFMHDGLSSIYELLAVKNAGSSELSLVPNIRRMSFRCTSVSIDKELLEMLELRRASSALEYFEIGCPSTSLTFGRKSWFSVRGDKERLVERLRDLYYDGLKICVAGSWNPSTDY